QAGGGAGLVADQDPGGRDGRAGGGQQPGDLAGQLLGQPLVVVVAEGDQLAGGGQGAAVAGPGQPGGGAGGAQDRGAAGRQVRPGQVGVALVEHDHALDRALV